ncbi:MAG: hypothetical protein R3E87_05185 [Burkholderiaceae bacterium]
MFKRVLRAATLIVVGSMVLSNAHANEPVVDFSYLLSGTQLGQADKTFLPGMPDLYRAAFANGEITATLTRKGDGRPIRTYSYTPRQLKGAISGLFLNDAGNFLKLDTMGQGDFTLTFRSDGKAITVMEFNLRTERTGDTFNPLSTAVLDGPWDDWALLRIPFGTGERDDARATEALQLVSWAQNTGADQMFAEIRLDGDLIAKGDFYLQRRPFEWQRAEFKLAFPDDKGGTNFKIGDLLARDGVYDVFFRLGDELVSAFQFEIKGGREVYHPRQAANHRPRTEYLIPRQYVLSAGSGTARGFDVVYMRALSGDQAKARFAAGPEATKTVDAQTLRKWQWQPTGDAARQTRLTLTDIATEADSTLRAGDEIIVFGNGYPAGVSWMKVGDTQARSIPEGETFDSRVFGVCGRKVVLTRDHALFVFDTEAGSLTPIPTDQVFLKDVRGGLHGNNFLACDGHLAATINDTRRVTDKLTIKVLDLSGARPVVIPIKNGPYQDNRLDNIAVDAAQGMVVMGSSNDDAIYYAPVVPMANQITVNLAKYKAIRASQPQIVDGGVVYADDEYKLRLLPFGATEPRRLTDHGFGRSSNGFFADHGRVVFVTEEKFGDRHEIAVGGLDGKPRVLDGTGSKIEGTSGALGMAGAAAIVPDGSVFLAGTPRGGIGTGEHLQVLDSANARWLPVTDENGTAFGAIDVVASERLVAFKVGERGDTRIGYVTFGRSLDVDELLGPARAKAAARTKAAEKSASDAAVKAQAMEQAKQSIQASQQDMAFIAAYLESHKSVEGSLIAAFGEQEGRQKAREMTVGVMQGNGHGHLVPLFEKMLK